MAIGLAGLEYEHWNDLRDLRGRGQHDGEEAGTRGYFGDQVAKCLAGIDLLVAGYEIQIAREIERHQAQVVGLGRTHKLDLRQAIGSYLHNGRRQRRAGAVSLTQNQRGVQADRLITSRRVDRRDKSIVPSLRIVQQHLQPGRFARLLQTCVGEHACRSVQVLRGIARLKQRRAIDGWKRKHIRARPGAAGGRRWPAHSNRPIGRGQVVQNEALRPMLQVSRLPQAWIAVDRAGQRACVVLDTGQRVESIGLRETGGDAPDRAAGG